MAEQLRKNKHPKGSLINMDHGFELIREQHIPEVNSHARLYRHVKTGAELLSLSNEDENKVFGITLRTPPSDSTGVAHILEHAVLNGSRKYQAKEPFVELVKGSLNTFLNAFTYPDKTCYPVASQNLQDFYNLIDVYLDAVFYPLISPYTFMQEGWHYELEDAQAEMTYKGVVFNEMKGAYSTPESVLDEESQHQLFPNNTYGVNSGGDPVQIPNLTYEQFKAFHQSYYHPSNARIYFYGDDDPTKRLEILDAYLSQFERIQIDSRINSQPRFNHPRKAILPYETSPSGDEPKHLLTVTWLLPEGMGKKDPEQAIAWSILDEILTGSPASPLRKALIESGLGEDLTGSGLVEELREPAYSIGMKGVPQENVEPVENLILSTLGDLAKEGIDPDTVAASLNTIEFQMRELNTGRFPRGLAVMLNALTTWLYDGDPFAPLCFDAPLAEVKKHAASGERYFEKLIEDHLLSNTHRVTVVLKPDGELAQRRAEAENVRLSQVRQSMNPQQVDEVITNTRELKRRQEAPDSPEALASIPMLALDDLDRQVRRIPSEQVHSSLGTLLFHDLFTSGILYLDLGFNLHTLPQEWLGYVPLFGRALTEMGTKDQSFVQLLQRIGQSTGGLWPQTFVSNAVERPQAEAWLFLRSKAMTSRAPELFSILNDVLINARLDDQARFRQMALEEKASLESGLIRAGHRVVNTRLRAHFGEAGWANEQMSGVSYLMFLRDLVAQIDADWPAVQSRLEELRARLVNQQSMVCNVTLDSASWKALQPGLTNFLSGLPVRHFQVEDWHVARGAPVEGLTIPSQVNFVGKAGNLYSSGYQLDGSIMAILQYLDAAWMWQKVRVEGGAYGGFCVFDQYSGVLSYLSYRDPNLKSTLAVYDQTPGFLGSLDIPSSELVKSIIGAVGALDAYQLPDAKGFTSLQRHLLGVSDERRQKLRDQLLGATPNHFRALAGALESLRADGKVTVLGSAEAIGEVISKDPGWMEVRQVL
jgi:Zn-dependent M16 (insulinase) family peptidase